MSMYNSTLTACGVSNPGLVRDNNEDSFSVRPVIGVLAVADGMGGAAAGEIASSIFIRQAELMLYTPVRMQVQGVEIVKQVFMSANQAIMKHALEHPHHAGLGCTAELMIFCEDGYVLGHVGDSRTYMFRNGHLKQLTRDHTLVQAQIEQGLLSTEEASSHPMRNVIVRAVGVKDMVAIDIIRGNYRIGDVFLLCSDGLTDMVSDNRIEDVIGSGLSACEICTLLVDMANEAGGRDNITVVVGEVA